MKFLLSFVIFGLLALSSAQEEDDEAMEVGGAIVIDGKDIQEKRALGRVYSGSACEYIKLSDISANSGCADGTKFVIKKADTVRKQLLIMSGTPILAFVTKGSKFVDCTSFTEVTMQVDCKTVDGLSDVDLSANSSSSGTCKCGIKKTRRIIGGTETTVNEYPWIAAFDFNGVTGTSPGGCAATLISTNWAVTASHCFYDQEGQLTVTKDTMSLVLGVHDRAGTTDTNRQVLTIAEIVLHPSYNPSGSSHDIALLKISETVDLDTWSPACLPTSGADFAGQNGWVYGWGTTSEAGSEGLADKLLELEVPIVSDSVCATAMSSQGVTITSDMLCAGGENGKDACAGDSGGPFTVADSGSGAHTLVGAVSFGIGCAREGLYGVYADVPFFRTWIDETIAAKGGATFCS